MTAARVELDRWPERLEAAIAASGGLFTRASVLRETESTQDAARRANAQAGEVFLTWRQTAGRGRLGRRWLDTFDDGLAVTFVLEADDSPRLAVVAAVAVAEAIESSCPNLRGRVGIKWPNDLIVSSRKVAGILIEQADRLACIGIGVNVHQQKWPAELDGRAISLAQAGASVDRIDLAAALVVSLSAAMPRTDEQLSDDFAARDVLHGSVATLRCGERIINGTIVLIDPMRGLIVRNESGETWIPASTATLLPASSDARATVT